MYFVALLFLSASFGVASRSALFGLASVPHSRYVSFLLAACCDSGFLQRVFDSQADLLERTDIDTAGVHRRGQNTCRAVTEPLRLMA